MGRSTAEQALQNRERIVAEAARLFRGRGVEAVSVADIMAAAGMTVGGFYKHFASKEALAREACALSFDQAAQVWRTLAKGDPESAPIVAHYFRKRPAHRTCPMLAYAPHVSSEPAPAAGEAYSEGAGALLTDFVGGADDPDEAQVLFAAMIGAQLLARASDGADWAADLQQAILRRARKRP